MLKATFDEREGRLTLELEGHAGQAEEGQDIVCSSCSILAYTVAQIVKDYAEDGKLKSEPKISLKKGYSIISCEPKKKAYAELQYAYTVARVGYLLLENNYPQFVELEMFGTEKSVNINQKIRSLTSRLFKRRP